MTWVVYLREELRLPVNLIQKDLERAGLSVNQGGIERGTAEVAAGLRPLYRGYREALRCGEAVNIDENEMQAEGENRWLWGEVTEKLATVDRRRGAVGELCPPRVYAQPEMGEPCGDTTCALCDDLDPCFFLGPRKQSLCDGTTTGERLLPSRDRVLDADIQAGRGGVPRNIRGTAKRGLNMIGNPFPFSVSVSDLQVRYEGEKLPLLEAQRQGWASAYLSGYALEAGEWN